MVKKVTSFDVAKLAGVSQPTVSRALRNMPGTSPQTRRKVEWAAKELSYIPSDLARSLSTTRSRRIAVVSEELTNPYYPQLVEPLRRHLSEHNLRTVVITDSEHRKAGPEAVADGSYDGVILTTTLRTSALPRDLTERGIPHVLVNRVLDHPESPSCSVDNASGARAIADLLAKLGHHQVAMVQGPISTSTGRERAKALGEALRERGIRVRRDQLLRTTFSHDTSRVAAGELLDREDRPTAIVGGNDVIALGILSAARERGLRVPEDLSVVGFDDIPMAGWPLINLTTIRCDLEELARVSVELLQQAMASAEPLVTERRVPVSLILRGTHGLRPDVTSR